MTLSCISQYSDVFLKVSRSNSVCLALVIPAAFHSSKLSKHADSGSLGYFKLAGDTTSFGPDPTGQNGLLIISRGTAILLLAVYAAYLWFQVGTAFVHVYTILIRHLFFCKLRTHSYLFQPDEEEEQTPAKMGTISAASAYLLSPTFPSQSSIQHLNGQVTDCDDRHGDLR
jgi:Ca2+:H+ antiporter